MIRTTTVSIAIVILTLAAVAVVTELRSAHGTNQPPPAPLTAAATQPIPTPLDPNAKIKVGVIISQLSTQGGGIGYRSVERVIQKELIDPSLELYPIIEPGTGKDVDILNLDRNYFHNRDLIDCSDSDHMAQLDVLVAPAVSDIPPPLLDALEKSVRDEGKGLLIRVYFGMITPGYTPRVLALAGLKEGQYANSKSNEDCVVTNPNPILGPHARTLGGHLKMRPSGLYGILNNGQILIQLVDPNSVYIYGHHGQVTQERDDFVFATAYTAQCGKGKIVGAPFGTLKSGVDSGEPLHGFSIRAIQWLAGRNHQTAAPHTRP